MVSLRRRKQLGYSTGVYNDENENANDEDVTQRSTSVRPLLNYDLNVCAEDPFDQENDDQSREISPVTASSNSDDQLGTVGLTLSNELDNQPTIGMEVKRRKPNRRKRSNDKEHAVMKGVYCKNKKWQAAIKVDGKQIHLGTVSTQEEAARLYDSAAYIQGRDTNNELSVGKKEELKKLGWDEFLRKTRDDIISKRSKRGYTIGNEQR